MLIIVGNCSANSRADSSIKETTVPSRETEGKKKEKMQKYDEKIGIKNWQELSPPSVVERNILRIFAPPPDLRGPHIPRRTCQQDSVRPSAGHSITVTYTFSAEALHRKPRGPRKDSKWDRIVKAQYMSFSVSSYELSYPVVISGTRSICRNISQDDSCSGSGVAISPIAHLRIMCIGGFRPE